MNRIMMYTVGIIISLCYYITALTMFFRDRIDDQVGIHFIVPVSGIHEDDSLWAVVIVISSV